MSDHSFDLKKKVIDQAIQEGTKALSAKKTEHDELTHQMKEWEEKLKAGKLAIQKIEAEMRTLESNQHTKIESLRHTISEHEREMAQITKNSPAQKPKPHSFL